jgi:hypothetical protein
MSIGNNGTKQRAYVRRSVATNEKQHPALSQTQHLVLEKEADKAIKRGLYMPHVRLKQTAVSMSSLLHLN